MFRPMKLMTVFVKAPLRHASGMYRKPYVIRFVFSLDIFTVLGVRLDIPPIILVSLHTLNRGPGVSGNVSTYKFLDQFRIKISQILDRNCFFGPDGEKSEHINARNLGQFLFVSEPPPWKIGISGWFLV
jgi:hypothetical protein